MTGLLGGRKTCLPLADGRTSEPFVCYHERKTFYGECSLGLYDALARKTRRVGVVTKKLLMGNEAFAHAALEAGVRVVAGYPGTPSSELIETIARLHASGAARGVHVEWSTNEKSALELLAGASYAGARCLFTCKQVGLNVASDALMSLNYVGVKGGLVLFVADDPGPISSQTEQDTRRFAAFAKVPVLDPSTPEEGFAMMQAAFDLSERYHTPVIVRPTTRVNHASTFFEVADVTEARPVPAEGFERDPKWVIFPRRAYEAHGEINDRLPKIAHDFATDPSLVRFNPGFEGGARAIPLPLHDGAFGEDGGESAVLAEGEKTQTDVSHETSTPKGPTGDGVPAAAPASATVTPPAASTATAVSSSISTEDAATAQESEAAPSAISTLEAGARTQTDVSRETSGSASGASARSGEMLPRNAQDAAHDSLRSPVRQAQRSSIRHGIVAGGVSAAYAREALREVERRAAQQGIAVPPYRFLQVGTPYPFPDETVASFVQGLDEVLVIEELDHVLEDGLLALAGRLHAPFDVRGRLTGDARDRGENDVADIVDRFGRFLGVPATSPAASVPRYDAPADDPLPLRPPILCAGCPHRGSFYAVKKALGATPAVFCGDIGCYTLGNAKPLDAVDTCLCMGAGITMAQGFAVAEPDKKHVAFVGDSTFFASGLPGIVNAVYNRHDVTVCVLDNATTAMTGSQPHPGTGVTLMGPKSAPVSIERVLEAVGFTCIVHADPLDLEGSMAAASEALAFDGPSAILFESPCIQLVKPGAPAVVDAAACTGCKRCIIEIGCPGIGFDGEARGPKSGTRGQAFVDAGLCNGCGLCVQICPFDALSIPLASPQAASSSGAAPTGQKRPEGTPVGPEGGIHA